MKHLVICVSMVLMLCQSTSGQAWSPYVPGQVSYYYTEYGNDTFIVVRALDTSYTIGNDTVFQFRSYSANPPYYFPGYYGQCDRVLPPDSLVLRNGAYIYKGYYQNYQFDTVDIPFYFRHGPGTTWKIPYWFVLDHYTDSLTLTIDSIYTGTFLGITDSLKRILVHFKNIHVASMVISRNNGFIEGYLPFPVISSMSSEAPGSNSAHWNSYSMFGITRDTVQLGYRPRKEEEMIQYFPGDVVKRIYRSTTSNPNGPPTVIQRYTRDSIISLANPLDPSSPYDAMRVRMNESGAIDTIMVYGEAHSTFPEALFLVNAHSYYYSLFFGSSEEQKTRDYKLVWYDTARHATIEYVSNGGGYDMANCKMEPGIGSSRKWYYRRGFSTKFGLMWTLNEYWDHQAPSSVHIYSGIIGYKSGTYSFGDHAPLLPTGLAALSNNTLQLHPNPATESFSLSLPDNLPVPANVNITDMQGRVVHREQYSRGTHIPISHLPTGPYIVEVILRDGIARAKLMKR